MARKVSLKRYFQNIIFLIAEEKNKLPLIVIFFLFLSLLELFSIALVGPLIAIILQPESLEANSYWQFLRPIIIFLNINNYVFFISTLLILSFFLKTFFSILLNKKIYDFSYFQELRIREKLVNSIQKSSYQTLLKTNSSSFIHSIQILAGDYARTLVGILKSLSDFITSVLICILLFITSPSIFLTLFSLISLSIIVFQLLFKASINQFGIETNNSMTRLVKGVQEIISGIKEIRVFGKENYFKEKIVSYAQAYSDAGRKYALLSSSPRYFLEIVLVLIFVITILVEHSSGTSSSEIISTLAIFVVASLRILPASTQLLTTIVTIQNTDNSLALLRKSLSIEKDRTVLVSENNFPDMSIESIKIDNLSFGYSNKFILKNLSCDIKAGEQIGIYGESGSGKSTLINCLIGLFMPNEGDIYINNLNISKNLNLWQSFVAYLPQNAFLIDDTITANIALGIDKDAINHNKVKEAIYKANLGNFIFSVDFDFDQNLGENGNLLSGGQKQRVAIARALYFDRKILILDESTSALDSSSERKIIKELGQLDKDIIKIIISHNHDLFANCDRVFELKDGKLIDNPK